MEIWQGNSVIIKWTNYEERNKAEVQPCFGTLFVPGQAAKPFSEGIFTLNEFVKKTFQESNGKRVTGEGGRGESADHKPGVC